MTSAPTRSLRTRLLVALLTTLVGMAAALALASPASASTADDEARLFQLTNDARAANGRAPLAYDVAASRVARAWAQELARSANLRHNPDLVNQIQSQVTGAWSAIGENVGYAGSIDSVQQAYMNSTGHRNNILGSYNRAGFGSARSSDGRVWTVVDFVQGPALTYVPANSFSPFASAAAFANQQYVDFLGRNGDDGGLISWTGALLSGQTNQAGLVASFMGSNEFGALVEPVSRLYLAYFGRNPDVSGLTYWAGQLRAGVPLSSVSNAFAASNEFVTKYGSLSDLNFVTLVYNNVLGRTPDPSGLQFWLGRLTGHQIDRGGVMTGFSESNEYRGATYAWGKVVSAYLGLLRRSPDPSGQSFWINQLWSGRSVNDLIAGILGSAEYRHRFGA